MRFYRQKFAAPLRRRGPTRGFGALIGEESTLHWLLNSQPAGGRSGEQREVVTGIIAALQQRLERLSVPRRFDFLRNAVQRAEGRETQMPEVLRPARGDLIRRHSALGSDLNELRVRWGADRDWGPTLVHAASAHAQMAYALRLDERKGAA